MKLVRTSATLTVALYASTAEATLITSALDPGSAKIIDFGQFAGTNSFGPGPIQVGTLVGESVVWSANNTGSAIFAALDGDYGLVDNGVWLLSKAFAGANGQPDDFIYRMRFDFEDGPVSGVGGIINYAATSNPVNKTPVARITAIGVGGVILESYDLVSAAPISTPSALNEGEFRGILRADADIVAFTLESGAIVIDDLSFVRASVVEPSTAVLGIGALLGMLAARRRQRPPADVCN